MTYLSVTSGIEAATVAWHPLGFRPIAFSEIASFPSAVLANHYPDVPNLGDMTNYKEWNIERPTILVGGTPCQSFSVAGLRRGLDDPRGSLMLVYLAIARRFRPRWIVWENVPGVLSSNGGRDFGTFLGGLGKLGYGFAYRILDAQFVRVESHPRAVPQRRRRVFVVGYLGDWRRAAAVLFERESLSGYPPPRRETGSDVAASLTRGADSNGRGGSADSLLAEGFDASEDGTGRGTPIVAQTVTADMYKSGGATAGNNPGVRNVYPLEYGVHRLTPRECERLQGFTDGYTAITYRGKPAADSPRYEALGNSMAVNVMRWIGERIKRVEEINEEESCTMKKN